MIRRKFNAPNTMIAQMMGVSEMTVRRELKKLGLAEGKGSRTKNTKWDKEGFYAWMHGVDKLPTPASAEEPIEEPVQAEPYPDTGADVIGCLQKRIDDLTAVLEKSEAENGWLRKECDNQRMQIRILEAQMEVVRMIFDNRKVEIT
jgi:hypothetical protein